MGKFFTFIHSNASLHDFPSQEWQMCYDFNFKYFRQLSEISWRKVRKKPHVLGIDTVPNRICQIGK
jgi:hypothetical protein